MGSLSGLLGRVGALRASIAGYVGPVVALVLGVAILDERVEAIQIVGVAVALLGGYILSKGRGSDPVNMYAHETGTVPEHNVVINLDASCAATNTR